jgi:hypothetical protein
MKDETKRILSCFLVLLLTMFLGSITVTLADTTLWSCDFESGGQFLEGAITYVLTDDLGNQTAGQWLIISASVKLIDHTYGDTYLSMIGFGFGAYFDYLTTVGLTYINSSHVYGCAGVSIKDDIYDYYGTQTYYNSSTAYAWVDQWINLELWYQESSDHLNSQAKFYINDELITEQTGIISYVDDDPDYYFADLLLVGHIENAGFWDWYVDDITAQTHIEYSWFGLYGDFFFGLIGVIMMLIAPSWLAFKIRRGWNDFVEIMERAFFALLLWLMGFALCMAWLGGNFWGAA